MTCSRPLVATVGVGVLGAALGALHAGCQILAGIEVATELDPDAAIVLDGAATVPGPVPTACSKPDECPRSDTPCLVPACVGGRCTTEAVPNGPLSVQTAGDCLRIECTNGHRVEVPSADDVPAEDGRECTESTCAGTSPQQRPKDVSVACGDGGVGFCNGSGECGPCKSGAHACFPGGVPALCTEAGLWSQGAPCASGTICVDGRCDAQRSCTALPLCQEGTRNCCDRPATRGGSFLMGRGGAGANDEHTTGLDDEVPEHTATLSPSSIEFFPVTVGRFRAFLNAYTGVPPATGAGAHPAIPHSGWEAAFNGSLAADKATLQASLACPLGTWTNAQGSIEQEQRPINCVSWFEASAFCIWDGGRLPTEAEWEYVAAGGDKNTRYPWGQLPPSGVHLIGNCLYDSIATCATADIPKVGIFTAGKGEFGHFDLAGSVRAWTLDWYSRTFYESVVAGCTDCVNLTPAIKRTTRGGGSFAQADALARSVTRASLTPTLRDGQTGVRCAH